MNSPRRSQVKLLLIVAIFAAPVLIAFALSLSGYRPKAEKNYGELLAPPVAFAEVRGEANGEVIDWNTAEGYWHVLLMTPAECTTECLRLVDEMQRVWIGLARAAPRVRMLYIGTPDDAVRTAAKNFAALRFATLEGAAVPPRATGARASAYLVDPNGYLVMRYPEGFDPIRFRNDLKKLIK